MKRKIAVGLAWGVYVLVLLACLEMMSQLTYRLRQGNWYFHDRAASPRGMIDLHPYFASFLVPNVDVVRNGIHITHNSFPCRGPEFARPKPPGRIRIVALGGSTTFCVGVSDNETWEHYLNEDLGAHYEVINLGSPGGTTVETMVQSALLFSDVQPDIAVYYFGWNDAQVQHIKNLAPDWSDYHGQLMQSQVFSSWRFEGHTATGYFLKQVLLRLFFHHIYLHTLAPRAQGTADALTDRIDERALSLYERNLREIAALCKAQGVRAVFVPQVMNYDALTSDKPYGWLPFVRDRDLKKVISAYNRSLAKIAREQNVAFAGTVLEQPWQNTDFIDCGHFSPAGNQRFARTMADYLKGVSPPETVSK